mmetsp:Transcript_106743/g.344435  ORF Transcript_106743/g.344435 Transcript_106743/m.344435 type:complete len:319 (+) Transcript_106743:3189-4145(+)
MRGRQGPAARARKGALRGEGGRLQDGHEPCGEDGPLRNAAEGPPGAPSCGAPHATGHGLEDAGEAQVDAGRSAAGRVAAQENAPHRHHVLGHRRAGDRRQGFAARARERRLKAQLRARLLRRERPLQAGVPEGKLPRLPPHLPRRLPAGPAAGLRLALARAAAGARGAGRLGCRIQLQGPLDDELLPQDPGGDGPVWLHPAGRVGLRRALPAAAGAPRERLGHRQGQLLRLPAGGPRDGGPESAGLRGELQAPEQLRLLRPADPAPRLDVGHPRGQRARRPRAGDRGCGLRRPGHACSRGQVQRDPAGAGGAVRFALR